MLDPRISVIDRRLYEIGNIIAVSGGKGGVGKSTVASLLSLFLCERKKSVGLLDLDFYGPSTHLILGIDQLRVEERMGIVPPRIKGISYMSISLFTKGNPLPIRGKDVSNLIIEILSATIWGKLDYLILDMPPGTGESTLDVLRLIRDAKFLLVTIPSKVALEVLKKELSILKGKGVSIMGVILNQTTDSTWNGTIDDEIIFIGSLPYDRDFERSIGSPERIIRTSLYMEAKKIFARTILKNEE